MDKLTESNSWKMRLALKSVCWVLIYIQTHTYRYRIISNLDRWIDGETHRIQFLEDAFGFEIGRPHSHRLAASLLEESLQPMKLRLTRKKGPETGWPSHEIAITNIVCLRVEYAERGKEYDIPFIFSLFCEYIDLEYVSINAILQGSTGGICYSYSCGCASGIRQYVFTM